MVQHCWHNLDKINHIDDGIFSATLTGRVDGGENSWKLKVSGLKSELCGARAFKVRVERPPLGVLKPHWGRLASINKIWSKWLSLFTDLYGTIILTGELQ